VRGLVAFAGLVAAGAFRVAGPLLGDASQFGFDPVDGLVALLLVAFGRDRVVADDEPGIGTGDRSKSPRRDAEVAVG
jgi:hypothetical protein